PTSPGTPAGDGSNNPSSSSGGNGPPGGSGVRASATPPESDAEGGSQGARVRGMGMPGIPVAPGRPASRHIDPEWIIIVDCRPEGVQVSPSRLAIAFDQLAAGAGGDALLVRTARDLIANRRGAQRPDEPPVKVVIRFLVHKDGLRTFHLAYPLLDSIDVEKRAVLSGE